MGTAIVVTSGKGGTGKTSMANSTEADSKAILPNHTQVVFLRATSLRETTSIRFGKAGAHPQLALGIAIAPKTLSHICNFLIFKAIAILSILS